MNMYRAAAEGFSSRLLLSANSESPHGSSASLSKTAQLDTKLRFAENIQSNHWGLVAMTVNELFRIRKLEGLFVGCQSSKQKRHGVLCLSFKWDFSAQKHRNPAVQGNVAAISTSFVYYYV